MQFPHPMNNYKFNNEYNMILFALSTIYDQLERKDRLFVAQCVCSLASLIHFTEVLIYYRH